VTRITWSGKCIALRIILTSSHAVFLSKIIKIGANFTKFWQKFAVFKDRVYIFQCKCRFLHRFITSLVKLSSHKIQLSSTTAARVTTLPAQCSVGPLFFHFEWIYTSLVDRLWSGSRSWVRIGLSDKVRINKIFPLTLRTIADLRNSGSKSSEQLQRAAIDRTCSLSSTTDPLCWRQWIRRVWHCWNRKQFHH